MPETDLSVCAAPGRAVHWRFWPEAEDRALRGRNLSAVFRTLYRQVGKSLKGLAFLCTHLAGREPMRKIHLPTFHGCRSNHELRNEKSFPFRPSIRYQLNPSTACPFFRGKSRKLRPTQSSQV